MKKAIVLSGVSGTGKTHARLHNPELKNRPHLDIADLYREFSEFDWYEALYALLRHVRRVLRRHDTVVIEGYFLPGSASRDILMDDLKAAGVEVEIRELFVPFEVCQERIVAQLDRGEISPEECRRRVELLKKCWRPQEATGATT